MSDDRTEDALRRVLSVEAQQVQPGGDGLSRIQQRVGARQNRLRWMRPALAGAVAIVVIGGAVGGYAIATSGNGGNQTVKFAHTTPPTPVVPSDSYPTDAIFPYTTAAEEQTWEASYAEGNSPWVSDPTAVTESWVEHYLLQHGDFTFSAQTTGASSDVTVSRTIGGTDHAVTVVHLVKYGSAWLVTGASDPADELSFSSPAAGTAVTSPLTVTGPGYGVDEVATVQVRDATTPTSFGQADTAGFGNGTAQWSATVAFTATSDAGVVVATVASPADGGVGTLAAEKVTFAASTGHATTTSRIYAVEAGSLVTLNPTTGASDGPVSAANAKGTVAEVRDIGGTLYFTAGAANCASTLYAMPDDGVTVTTVATADPGYAISGFDLTADGTKLTYYEAGCGSEAGKGTLIFTDLSNGTMKKIVFPGEPPLIMGDPVWEPDGVHVDAFVRTGMQGYLAQYDSAAQGQGSAQPDTSACTGYQPAGGMADVSTATGPDGTLWFATQTGTSMQVVSCADNKPTVEFSTPDNDTPLSLSINAAGDVLVVGDAGKVYEWEAHGDATELSNSAGVTSVAW
jgi:hypothetical protein